MIQSRHVCLLILAAVLAGCSSPMARPHAASPLGSWTVTLIGSAIVDPDHAPTLTFDEDGSVHGGTGVNMLRGRWTLDALGLQFHAMVTTRMAGPPELMDQERRLLATLERVGALRGEDLALLLLEPEGGVLLRLEPTAAD